MHIGTCFGTIFTALNIIAREKGMDATLIQKHIAKLVNIYE